MAAMGLTGHIGIAFEPQDEATALASFTGSDEAPEGDDWVRYQTGFGLIRENWWEMHRTFERLAANDSSLAVLASVVDGHREFGAERFSLFKAAEVQAMAEACSRVSGPALELAISQALAHSDFASWFAGHPELIAPVSGELTELFHQIAGELDKVSAGGLALVAGMF